MDFISIKKSYARYAPFYNFLFGRVLQNGRLVLAQEVKNINPKNLLEVGVGTGLLLSLYPKNIAITGLDVSEKMLDEAKKRIHSEKLDNVTVACYDGEKIPFPCETFECVTLPYVYSVTPDPEAFINECWRVCAIGGRLIILNHFSESKKITFWSVLEFLANPLAKKIGFNSNFSYQKHISKLNWNIAHEQDVNFAKLSKVIIFIKY